MDAESLRQYEQACERVLTATSRQDRVAAEELVVGFLSGAADIPKAHAILSTSGNHYANFLTLHQLLQIVTNHWNGISAAVRLNLLQFVLDYSVRGPVAKQAPQIASNAATLLSRLLKQGWLDDDVYRRAADDLIAGRQLRILNTVVDEMNTVTAKKSLTQHRKVSVAFRDSVLLKIFELSLEALLTQQGPTKDALQLANSCLSFDFVGLFPDDSSDETTTIQIPANWRTIIEDENSLRIFFEVYSRYKDPLALQCLVQMACVRRSIFRSDEERKKFLTNLLAGITIILKTGLGMDDATNRHEMCRLLSRLKSTNFPLSDIIAVDPYTEWIQISAQFAVATIADWETYGNSAFYLLGFFSRLMTSQPHLKSPKPSQLPEMVPNVVQTFLLSRLSKIEYDFREHGSASGSVPGSAAAAAAAVAGNPSWVPDFLHDKELLSSQLDSVPYLVRSLYDTLGPYVLTILDPLINVFGQTRSVVVAAQLAFLIYIAGGIVSQRGTTVVNDPRDAMDGDLVARVFQVVQMSATFTELSTLELSILYFFQQLRSVYIGEQSMTASAIFTRLTELCGMQNHLHVLEVMMNRILSNLQIWSANSEIVEETLVLFRDLASGFSTRRLLMKIPSVPALLSRHCTPEIAFLRHASNFKNRSVYYTTLCRLLSLDECSPAQFSEFMSPFVMVSQNLSSREVFVGFLRDLRGISIACASKRAFERFFEWMYPDRLAVIHQGMDALALDADFTIACLRFLGDFAHNRSQRILFGPSSPNGILLFKEISKILCTFAAKLLVAVRQPQTGNVYKNRLKPIWLALTILTYALTGRYCNFGVFALYHDDALTNALASCVELALSVPQDDVLSFPKLGRAYYAFASILFTDHCNVLIQFDSAVVLRLVSSLLEGVKSLDSQVSCDACGALDHLCSFYVAENLKGSPVAAVLRRHFQTDPTLLPNMLSSLMQLLVFEEYQSQYALSRPLLALIVMNPPWYDDIKQSLSQQLGGDRGEKLIAAFEKLMAGVETNLESKNRDLFSQNVTLFRQELRKFL